MRNKRYIILELNEAKDMANRLSAVHHAGIELVIDRIINYPGDDMADIAKQLAEFQPKFATITDLSQRLGQLVDKASATKSESITPTLTPIPREDRLYLARAVYGLYTFGLAQTDRDRIDEDCAMDNQGIPYYLEQLTDSQRLTINESHGTKTT